MVARTEYMIDQGINSNEIVLFTFTNKAAKEIKERLISKLGNKARDLTVGTFHSVCVRILKRYADKIGYSNSFSIFDTTDCTDIIKKISKRYNLDYHQAFDYIERKKRKGISYQEAIRFSDGFEEKLAGIYRDYQMTLIKDNAMDFNDLIFNTINLLENNIEIREKIQNRWKYFITDESQDASKENLRLIELLVGETHNICFVGDYDQCLIEGTKIKTKDGEKNIEDIKENDKIISAIGRGEYRESKISSISKTPYKGNLIVIKTKSGKIIKCTPNHIVFANQYMGKKYYVYLMYKPDLGYRIGLSKNHGDSTKKNGYEIHSRQEGALYTWCLFSSDNQKEAAYMEQYFAYTYGIPLYPFKTRRDALLLDQEYINKLFNSINTEDRAKKLLKDLDMDYNHPHYIDATSNMINVNIIFTMFGDINKSPDNDENYSGYNHELLCFNTMNFDFEGKIKNITNCEDVIKINGVGNSYCNGRWSKKYQEELLDLGEKIKNIEENNIFYKGAYLTTSDNKMDFIIAANVREGMTMAIIHEDKVINEEVVSVTKEYYDGFVYDLNVPHYRNYFANNICVHNCIYGFRGADISAILGLDKTYPEIRTHYLRQNYRSTQTIVNASKSLIEHNVLTHKDNNLFSDNKKGEPIIFFEEEDSEKEAIRCVKLIKTLTNKTFGLEHKDIAILYRMGYMSRILEKAFLQNGIPYEIVGGVPFCGRKEVKDILSYIKFIYNPFDYEALKRCINIPKRGIGEKKLEELQIYAQTTYSNPIDYITALKEIPVKGKSAQNFKNFLDLINKLKEDYELNVEPSCFINTIMESIDYKNYIYNTEKKKSDAEERLMNLQELLNIASHFSTIQDFLDEISLNSSNVENDNSDSHEKVNLMTLHASKGLEFQAVIIINSSEFFCPHYKALSKEEIEEERRLYYVGMTRAKEYLFLTRSKKIFFNGRYDFPYESRFINEIDKCYLKRFQ